jgi:arabinose-5-phosphate isomerase
VSGLREEARRVLEVEAKALLALVNKLDNAFDKAVSLLDGCKGRVIITGMGKSGLIGKKITATFTSIGVPSSFLHPAEAIHGDLGMVTNSDIVVAISNSGETEELVSLIPHLKRFNVPLIVMSGNASSTLAKSSDAHIDISVAEEACPLGIVPTASSTAALAMGDALAVALIKQRGFKAEDFAMIHPGGSLGKKLLIKVKDLMHSGERLPLIAEDAPMMKALVEISSKRLGIGIITGKKGELKGVLTDGDLRRGIEKWGKDFFDLKAGEAMSPNPKSIREDELAARALSIMEAHSITALVVPDSDGKPIGIIHIHDILKKGIA